MNSPILAVDPGLRTGLAWMVDDQHQSAEVTYEETGSYIQAFIMKYPDARIVCESFIITMATAKKAQSPWSLKLIGVVEFLCRAYQIAEPAMQSPSSAKKFSSDARLKALGWYKGNKGDFAGHADDASRHLLLYMAKRKEIDLGKIVDV